jgi:CRISPR system Cascade subunit CasE
MSWLARLEVDTESARREGIWDNYAWHKRLWEDCIPKDRDSPRDFLSRIEQMEAAYRVWIMVKRKPVQPPWCLPENFAIKEIAPSFLTHRYYAFDLMANPVKTMARRGPNGKKLLRPDGKPLQGKRIPLVKEDELREWLVKKGKVRCRAQNEQGILVDVSGGFQIVEDKPLEIRPMVEAYFRKTNKKSNKVEAAYHGGVQFRGILEVTDREKFIETYQSGIGSAKGFGFGLLLLAPINL